MLENSRVDYHVHSSESDGEARPDQIPELARQAGLVACAITDHFDPQAPGYDPVPGKSLDLPRFLSMLKWRDEWRLSHRERGMELFVGIERGPTPVWLGGAAPDLVIASVHYLPADTPTVRGRLFDETYWRLYMKTVFDVASGPQVDVVGHMAGYLPINPMPGSTFEERREIEREIGRRYFVRDWYERVFRVAAARGIACELHCPTRSPSPDTVRLGLDMGVKFSVGSDAHSASWIGDVSWAYDLLTSLGARQADIWSPGSRS
jgi:histidinol phosphatase-like PHP family hydrolase